MYPGVVEATRIPGSRQRGLLELVERLRAQPSDALARLTNAMVPERLAYAVEALRLDGNLAHGEELVADLSGRPLSVGRLRTIRRELGLSLKMAHYTASNDPIWLFRQLALLIAAARFDGWFLLPHEVELIGKTGIGMRARAYANVNLLTAQSGLHHTVAVRALATNFRPEAPLGPARPPVERRPAPGEVTGLLTQVDREGYAFEGEVQVVEAPLLATPGTLRLTGFHGQAMEQSARAALSYLQEHLGDFRLPSDVLAGSTMAVHLVGIAVPREGPSPGLTFLLAMVSALPRRPVRPVLAVSGEVSLHGDVGPVGGLIPKWPTRPPRA